MPSAMRQCWTSTLLDNEAFLAYSKAMSAACLSWATTCIAPCDVSVGFRFGCWAGEERVRMIAMF